MTRPAAKTNAFSTETKATSDRPQCSRTSPATTEMQKESAATCRPDNAELHELLEFLNDRYNCTAFVADDPVAIPHDYTSREDIEISGFLAATIAWGKRPMIVTNGRRLMERMDRAPYDFVLNASERELGALAGFVHRTFNDGDCIDFIRALRPFYAHSGSAHHPAGISRPALSPIGLPAEPVMDAAGATPQSQRTEPRSGLGGFFEREYAACGDMRIVLSRFRTAFWQNEHRPRAEKHLASIDRGASCKRLNMFLRWMVRRDDRGVDFGLWPGIPASALYLPLDVHTSNVARALGLLARKQNDWRAVEEVTASLRRFDPADPVKYDYALFGAGMDGKLKPVKN